MAKVSPIHDSDCQRLAHVLFSDQDESLSDPPVSKSHKLLQLCLGNLRQSRPFHHLPCFRRSLLKETLEYVSAKLEACDRPPDVVITNRIGKAISVWHNCAESGEHGIMEVDHKEERCDRPSPYPQPSRNLDDNCDVDSSQWFVREYAGSR